MLQQLVDNHCIFQLSMLLNGRLPNIRFAYLRMNKGDVCNAPLRTHPNTKTEDSTLGKNRANLLRQKDTHRINYLVENFFLTPSF
ncbi:hypothetical protein Fmac_011587 [Flemingia macrophylla]|uniref:Uncharacterized protein n=1 Tax=Flemingia macrophylla TaxID=520843 RepID=A0ABD1MN79_9FABA